MMSRRQRMWMMKRQKGGLWFDACATQGWDFDDEARRHALYQQALGGRAKRFSEFTNAEFDRVKALFQRLADSVQGGIEEDHRDIGEARRLRHVVRDQIKCLALYLDSPDPSVRPATTTRAEAYVAEIIADKFNHARKAEPLTLDELSAAPRWRKDRNGDWQERPSELLQLVETIDRVLNHAGGWRTGKNGQSYYVEPGLRGKAGQTLHEMKMAAGVECGCATFCRPRPRIILPATTAEEVEVKETVECPF